jgi:hypothetical protein
MNTLDFMKKKLENGMKKSVKGMNYLVSTSFEAELLCENHHDDVREKMVNIGGGYSSHPAIKSNNGWNDDTHIDRTVHTYDDWSVRNGGKYHDVETSTSPLNGSSFLDVKEETAELFNSYKKATGNVCHSVYASNHIHITLAYSRDSYYENVNMIDVEVNKAYENIGRFMLKYMPTLKWLAMTTPNGARGSYNNHYDTLESDGLFSWFYDENMSARNMDFGRGSYMRIHQNSSLHWENRILDCNMSPTLLASWMGLNRAITLWAIDFAQKGYKLTVTDENYRISKHEMGNHRRGWERVNKEFIAKQWDEMKGYLAKYLKISDNMQVIDMFDKLIENPVPAFLDKNNMGVHYNPELVEKSFNTRNRGADEELRESYLKAIDAMCVPIGKNLDEFQNNMASFLGVDVSKVKSQYQVIKRSNIVDLEFLAGRLVLMD